MNKGFTLIELLVVVLIIGILATVALPQYQKAVEKARMAEAVSIVSSVEKGIDLYLLENGYPPEGTSVAFLGYSAHANPDYSDPDTTYLHPSLNIDVASTLNCTSTPEDDAYCYSNTYAYYASCSATECSVYAERISSPNGLHDDEQEERFVMSSGTIGSRKTISQERWIHTCYSSYYDQHENINLALCQQMWKN